MNITKLALLGTAAVAAVSVSARADELSDLKAQVEALNARVAQVEAAPSVPAGYQLLTIGEGKAIQVPGLESDRHMGDKATVISVMPTADMPAAAELTWAGLVRAAIVYHDVPGSDDNFDIKTRGQLVATGKTDTAVGEVGGRISLRANTSGLGDPSVISNEQWGWWAMTPELTLGGGYTGSLGNIGYGYDGACNCYITDNADVAFNPGDTTQMRLSYASGPIAFAIALEDATGSNNFSGDHNSVGVAGEMKFTGDTFNGELSAVWREGGHNGDDSYQVGLGLGANLDMFKLSLAGAIGHVVTDQDFWGVSALASANLSDAVHAEVAAGYKNYDSGVNNDVTAVLAGVYYDPVSQLTVGLEGEYINPKGSHNNETYVDLVTVYRF